MKLKLRILTIAHCGKAENTTEKEKFLAYTH